jgi:hypothetical protein
MSECLVCDDSLFALVFVEEYIFINGSIFIFQCSTCESFYTFELIQVRSLNNEFQM